MRFHIFVAAMVTGAAPAAAASPALYVGTNPGSSVAQVAAFDGSGQRLATITPYDGFNGGVRVATGDVNGDGAADLITGAGPGGGPHVKVFDGRTGAVLHSFFAYEAGFMGGVSVGAGDLDGDGRADVVTGAGAGSGPHVRVFSGRDGGALASLFAFDQAFMGGVRVAAADFGGDGRVDLIAGAGPGGGPHLRIFDGLLPSVQHEFFAFEPGFVGGISLATGRYRGENALFVGAGEGGGGQVKAFSLADGRLLSAFTAFDPGFAGGVNVGFARIGGRDMLVVGMASRGGTLGLLDVSGRGRSMQGGEDAFSYLTPFGTDYADGVSLAGVAAVPEPSAWALMISGFALAGMASRRRLRGGKAWVSA